jgi:hypothetical protein
LLPFSHALIATLQLITSGFRPRSLISSSSSRARSYSTPFSHALIPALQLITSGLRLRALISFRSSTARSIPRLSRNL